MGLNIQSSSPSSSSSRSTLPQFLELQPDRFQELYSIFASAPDPSDASSLIPALATHIATWDFDHKQSYSIAKAFYHNVSTTIQTTTSTPAPQPASTTPLPQFLSATLPSSPATLSRQDLEFYINAVLPSPSATLPLRRLLLSAAVFYRRNYHPKQWVQYDRRSIFFLAGLSDMSTASQESLTNTLHTAFAFDLRVIGSKSPIPCFCFTWMADQQPLPALDPSNPLIDLGPYAPQTIATLASLDASAIYDLIEGALSNNPPTSNSSSNEN